MRSFPRFLRCLWALLLFLLLHLHLHLHLHLCALLALVVLLQALLCPAALLAAAVAANSAYATTLYAEGLPRLCPGVLVVQVLLQCFPGWLLLLLLLLHLTPNPIPIGQQRTSRRAVPCATKMNAPAASASQSARSARQLDLGPREANLL